MALSMQDAAREMPLSLVLASRDMGAAWEDQLSSRLYEAAARGQSRKFNQLLADGANPNWSHPNGSTALHIAAQKGRSAFVLSLLSAGANTGATDARSYTALQIFVKRISYNVLGGFIFCRTGSTYDCLVQLTYLTRAQSKKAEPEAPQDIMFEGIAVLHPGEEVDLAFAAR